MRKGLSWVVACLFLTGLAITGAHARDAGRSNPDDHGTSILTFDTMYGVDGPFIGERFDIRGIPGDELPWTVRLAEGFLDAHGRLTIKIRGLVFKNSDEVPPELRGKNDEPTFRGMVSCLTEEGDQVVPANVITRGFRATRRGDSDIHAAVALPNPCVAPIILVLAGSEDKWFAVTGFERE